MFEKHLLKDTADLNAFKKQIGTKEFISYGRRIWHYLAKMKPGQRIRIEKEVKPLNISKFVKLAQLYENQFGDIIFSPDFKHIIKQGAIDYEEKILDKNTERLRKKQHQ